MTDERKSSGVRAEWLCPVEVAPGVLCVLWRGHEGQHRDRFSDPHNA